MADHDDNAENAQERRRFNRRAFLAGGAAIGGSVLWGSAAEAKGDSNPFGDHFHHHYPPHIPRNTHTGGTGHTAGTELAVPNATGAAGNSGSTGPTGATGGTGSTGSSGGAPLFRNRFG